MVAGGPSPRRTSPADTGLVVLATRKDGRAHDDVILNPPADTRLEAGDDVIVLGEEEQVRKLREYVG